MPTQQKKRRLGLKIFLSILGLFFLAILTLLLVQWVRYIKDPDPYKTFIIPRLEISMFELTVLDLDKTEMIGRMLVHSPLPFNLRADSLEYKIFIEGTEVIKSTYPKSLNIKHWDSTWITLPVTTYTEKLMAVLSKAENEGKDSVTYEVQTSFSTYILFRKKFDVSIEKLLPLVYIPKVTLEKIVYDSLNFEGVTLFLHTTIVNKNQIPLTFKDLSFEFAIADNDWIKGSKPGTVEIADSSTTSLVLPLRISFKQIGKSIWPLIKEGKNTDYKLNLKLKLVSESNAMRNSQVFFKDAGTIKEIVKVAKEEGKKAKEKKKQAKEEGREPDKKSKKKIKIEKKKD